MRKMIILFLLVGIVLAAVSTIAGISEEYIMNGYADTSYDTADDTGGGPIPCGGGMGSGGGGAPG